MKIKFFLLLIILTLFSVLNLSATTTAAAPQSAPLSGPKQIQKLLAEGKYTEAQKIYEAALQNPKIKPEQIKKIRRRYENLNLQLLFSRFESPDGQFYTVVEGDSLYKIAKKFHTTVALIKKSNGLKNDTIQAGMKLKVINGTFSIHVDKSENVMTLLLNDKPIKHFRVATGIHNGTPAGQFKIINKLENPTWYKAGLVVPPGSPENSLGTRWLGFDHPGYGIHGTTEPESIGKQVTSGCVRMYNEEVEKLYDLVPVGTTVIIAD